MKKKLRTKTRIKMDKYDAKAVMFPGNAAIDETGVTIAFVRADTQSGEINFHWLPELFIRPIPPAVKAAIVEKLRFHADKLESGEMEQRMQRFAGINASGNRSEREQ